ncbi:hypothetical protein C8F01DRAFT_633844 [Mycena amicta]|nr:hypothetical protein C8F01DRAFT_633844 [Mycena amicta]
MSWFWLVARLAIFVYWVPTRPHFAGIWLERLARMTYIHNKCLPSLDSTLSIVREFTCARLPKRGVMTQLPLAHAARLYQRRFPVTLATAGPLLVPKPWLSHG